MLNLEFYGLPILLENVPGEELLGTTCSTQQGAIRFVNLEMLLCCARYSQ